MCLSTAPSDARNADGDHACYHLALENQQSTVIGMHGHSIETTCACGSLAEQHTSEQAHKEASFQAAKQIVAAVSAPAPSIELVALAPAPVEDAAVADAPAPSGPQLPGTSSVESMTQLCVAPFRLSAGQYVCQASFVMA